MGKEKQSEKRKKKKNISTKVGWEWGKTRETDRKKRVTES